MNVWDWRPETICGQPLSVMRIKATGWLLIFLVTSPSGLVIKGDITFRLDHERWDHLQIEPQKVRLDRNSWIHLPIGSRKVTWMIFEKNLPHTQTNDHPYLYWWRWHDDRCIPHCSSDTMTPFTSSGVTLITNLHFLLLSAAKQTTNIDWESGYKF